MLVLNLKFYEELIIKKFVDSIIKQLKTAGSNDCLAYAKILELKKVQYENVQITFEELIAITASAKFNYENNQTFMIIGNESGLNDKQPIETDLDVLLHTIFKEGIIDNKGFNDIMDFVIKNPEKELFIFKDSDGTAYLAYSEPLVMPKGYENLATLSGFANTKLVLDLSSGIQY